MASYRISMRSFQFAIASVPKTSLTQSCHISSKALASDAIDELLSKPTWSVKALQTTANSVAEQPSVTQKQLNHLLRLSALPLPVSPEEESKMLDMLQSQLQFVQAIRGVNTTGVEPLQCIRDETSMAQRENEISVHTLKDELAKEEHVGFSGRIVRTGTALEAEDAEHVDPLAQAPKTLGRYVVVNTKED